VVLVNDLYEIEQVAEHADASAFGSYYQCEIMPLGHYLRGKLITHWVSLETGDGFDQADLIREIDIREKLISTLLGTQLLPSFPIFVLGMLQAIEASKNLNTASGSYGELYEALITDRFRIVSGRATEVGTKYVFVARMAYYMFVRSQIALSYEDVAEVSRQYFAQFAMLMEPSKILTELEEAQVLYRINGHYRFRYPYYYHFFVARYFRDNIGDRRKAPGSARSFERWRTTLRLRSTLIFWSSLCISVAISRPSSVYYTMLHTFMRTRPPVISMQMQHLLTSFTSRRQNHCCSRRVGRREPR